MVDIKQRLAAAQWVLERNIAWISSADVKAAVVVSLDIGMLGGLAAAFGLPNSNKTDWAYVLLIITLIFLSISLTQIAVSVKPRTNGPTKSLVFFGRIKELPLDEFIKKFAAATDVELLEDWLAQIHRNAEIAARKHQLVSSAMDNCLLGFLPWAIAVYLLVKG